MAKSGGFDAAFVALCIEWNSAEKAIKLAEQVNGEIINPAIYELRYSGRRVIEALPLLKTDETKAKKLLDDAIFDCCRAKHDAIDAATSKIAADIKIAVDKLKPHIVLVNFPKITELYKMLTNVRKKIAVSRENREKRDAIYETIVAENLQEIVDLYEEFKSSEPLLIAAAKRERLVFGLSVVLGILGLIATLAFGWNSWK